MLFVVGGLRVVCCALCGCMILFGRGSAFWVFVVCCLLGSVRCLVLCVVRCVLCVVWCSLFVVVYVFSV